MLVRRLLQCLPIAMLAATAPTAPITFNEIAVRAGVAFTSNSGPTPQKHQPEAMVGGVAIFDFDGDGYPDLYFVNGADMPSLEKTGPQYKNRLFRNNHDLTFTDVTDKAGVAGSGYGMGVAVGDYDNDGRPDLFVTSVNGNQLFHNNGGCRRRHVRRQKDVVGGRGLGGLQ
jgi:enediyne biosynthesis protein E4